MLHYTNLDLETIDGEIWKPIPNYEQFYEASNLGRIKSLDRVFEFGRKNAQKVMYFSKIIEQYKNERGYLIVGFSDGINKNKTMRVHQMIAQAFIPNSENKPTVDHLNGIKDDNRVENLRWATWKEQGETTKKMGLVTIKLGSDHHQSKKVYQYNLNGELVDTHGSCGEASRKTGFSSAHINKNCNGKHDFFGDYVFSYKELPIEYFNRDFKKKTRKEKVVIKYDVNGIELERYFNCTEASEKTGLGNSNIHYCCIGRYHTCGGFKWKYSKDVESETNLVV